MRAHAGGDAAERRHAVERRDLDAQDAWQGENPIERRIVVRDAARALVEIEREYRQLGRERLMVAHGIVAAREREQGVGAAGLGLPRHPR